MNEHSGSTAVAWKCHYPAFESETILNDATSPWAGHRLFGYDLVANMRPEVIVELGTHRGTSFFSFCQAVKDKELQNSLYAVDSWRGDKHAGYYDEDVYSAFKYICDTCYDHVKAFPLMKTFDEALNDFGPGSIDLLHIDGLHTYEAVKHDFESWFGKVKNDGLILFHDIAEMKDDFGVYRLWSELKADFNTIEFHHSHGLGVLFGDRNAWWKVISPMQSLFQHYYSGAAHNYLTSSRLREAIRELVSMNELLSGRPSEAASEEQKLNIAAVTLQRSKQELESLFLAIRDLQQSVHERNSWSVVRILSRLIALLHLKKKSSC